MVKIICAAGLVVAVSGANAAFSLNSVDLGGDSASFGSPITTSTSYYQDGFGNNYPPSAAFVGFFPSLASDSYVAMDNMGPSSGTYTAAAPGGATPGNSATGGFFTAANTVTGGYFTGGGVASGADPFGGNGVMIAQLTTSGTLTGNNIRVNTSGDSTGTFSLVLNGAGQGGLYALAYNGGDSGQGTRWQIWGTDAPTPGAATLLGLAGLAGVRRRR